MAEKQVEIAGLKELKQQLERLPARIEANITRTALRRGALVIEERAKELCPVDSGELQDSIKVRAQTKKKSGWINLRVTAGGGKAFYANMVEYGTAPHEIRPKSAKSLFVAGVFRQVVSHPGATARPFMRPAFDEKYQDAIKAFADYMRQRIPREIKKQGL